MNIQFLGNLIELMDQSVSSLRSNLCLADIQDGQNKPKRIASLKVEILKENPGSPNKPLNLFSPNLH